MSGGRPGSLFRGTELPRLVLLAGIVLAGWPIVLVLARGGGGDAPAPAAPAGVPAAGLPPVVPDSGVEFDAIADKVPMRLKESAAYRILVDRARSTPAADLARDSRRDLVWTHLWERPAKYRGVPIRVEGTARRVISYEVNPELAPSGRMYEAWIYSDENRRDPYVLAFEEPPAGLAIGPEQFTRVRFDGYFFKLLGYRAGDTFRAAPMLVGRIALAPALTPAPSPMVELRNLSKRNGFVIAFVLLFAYITVRAVFQVRKAIRPGRDRPRPRAIVNDEIAPVDLAEWLRSVPDETGGPGPRDGGPTR